VKKRYSLNNEEERVEKILRSNIADKVVLGGKGDKYDVIKRNEPDIICLGYDQEFFIDELKEKLQEFGFLNTKVFRIKSFKPEVYKSSKLRNLGK
jgi:glycerol-3-phosphate cytidylyltransferase-like family protein